MLNLVIMVQMLRGYNEWAYVSIKHLCRWVGNVLFSVAKMTKTL